MKVGIFMHPIGSMKRGQEKYVHRVTTEIIKAAPDIDFTVYTKGAPSQDLVPIGPNLVWKKLPTFPFWREWELLIGSKNDVNVFFTERTPLLTTSKVVSVFFDSGYLQIKPTDFLAKLKHALIKWQNIRGLHRTDAIVVPSKSSAADLENMLHIEKKHIKVVYPGFDKVCKLHEPIAPAALIEKNFFSYVGPVKERKNVLGMVKAFERFCRITQNEYILAIAGRTGSTDYFERVQEFIYKKKISNRVIFLGSVSNQELSYIYQNTEAFIFPSTVEGFGLPILEAMSCGALVVASDVGGTAEAAGDAGILVNPLDVEDFSQKLVAITNGTIDSHKHVTMGLSHAEKFSWQRAGREWLEIISNVST